MKSFKYSENYQNVTQKHEGTNAKNGAHRFFSKDSCHKPSVCKYIKSNNMRYVQ